MTPRQFKQTRHSLGWSLSDASNHLLVNVRTIRRYEDEMRPKPIPAPVVKLLEIYAEKLIKKGEK